MSILHPRGGRDEAKEPEKNIMTEDKRLSRDL